MYEKWIKTVVLFIFSIHCSPLRIHFTEFEAYPQTTLDLIFRVNINWPELGSVCSVCWARVSISQSEGSHEAVWPIRGRYVSRPVMAGLLTRVWSNEPQHSQQTMNIPEGGENLIILMAQQLSGAQRSQVPRSGAIMENIFWNIFNTMSDKMCWFYGIRYILYPSINQLPRRRKIFSFNF